MSAGRDLTMGRALQTIPLPELPEDFWARLGQRLEQERPVARSAHRRLLIALAVGILIAVILGSIALAGGFEPLHRIFDPLHDTFWPRNENGQTFGSSGVAKSYEDEPDLIAVASDGKRGYCYKSDLDGPAPLGPPGAEPPYDINLPGMLGYAIPKYESDGTTQIGVFRIGGGGGGGGVMADGSKYETCADAHGTRITTTRTADGSIMIQREWLDGRRTVNTAEDDPSLSRLPAAERPTTWRDISLWFRDDGLERHGHTSSPSGTPDWLAGRMSAVARAAGDPSATARWTITYRRCAAPFDGPASLASDEAKWSVVWIAILRGDFTTWPPSAGGSVSPGAYPGGFHWQYLLLDPATHEVIAQGASAGPFDTSMFHLQGRTQLPAD
jgi:hypothetical protein